MGEVHHGHSAVHVSSVASFGRVVIFIPFVLTAVGNLSALRRAGESVWPTRSPIWIENPVCALTRVPVRSSCNWEWVSCPWFILLSQYDWAPLLSPENAGKIEHFTLRAPNPSTACMHFLRVSHATHSTRTLCVALNETQAAEYLGFSLELSTKSFCASSNSTPAEKEMRKKVWHFLCSSKRFLVPRPFCTSEAEEFRKIHFPDFFLKINLHTEQCKYAISWLLQLITRA